MEKKKRGRSGIVHDKDRNRAAKYFVSSEKQLNHGNPLIEIVNLALSINRKTLEAP